MGNSTSKWIEFTRTLQLLKVSVIEIGFAVISVGVMFIVLGINDGGGEAGGSNGAITFNFKTGSTGVLVFVAGAAMSTAGGVLKNEYKTADLPEFAYEQVGPATGSFSKAQLANVYGTCAQHKEVSLEHCLADVLAGMAGKDPP